MHAIARPSNGRRISCKKRESRSAFELRRQLNSHVGRRCASDDRRMFRRPLNGRAASVQLTLNLHCRKGNVRLKRMLGVFIYTTSFNSVIIRAIFAKSSSSCRSGILFSIAVSAISKSTVLRIVTPFLRQRKFNRAAFSKD